MSRHGEGRPLASVQMVDGIGRVLGDRYRLTALIGTGASASVYVADDRKLGRRVAVKILHPALAGDRAFLHRFREEARSAARLNHPGLMSVYDTDADDATPYLVLEYLGGGSLRALLDAGHRLSVSQALAVGLEAAQALARAHQGGIVHRDIKPANLLFDLDGRLRIADFGLARALSESGFTDHGDKLVGTARYAAPEQGRAVRVDGKADVYALGLVLTECVTGSVPLVLDGPVETLMARQDTPVPVPPELGPLRALVERMGRADPAERPSAGEVVEGLLAVAPTLPRPDPLPLAGVPLDGPVDDDVTVLPDGDRTGYLPPIEPPAAGTGPGGPGRARRPVGSRGRRRLLLAGLAALLVISGGGAAVWAVTRPPTAEVPDVGGLLLAEAEETLHQAMRDAGDVSWTIEPKEAYHRSVPEGAVISQDPERRRQLRDGGTVTIVISLGPPLVPIPDLTGKPAAAVEKILEDVRLELGTSREANDETMQAGLVLTWQVRGVVRPGPQPEGSLVDIVVSAGPAQRKIPTVAGKAEAQARADLEALQLVVSRREVFSDTVAAGLVAGTEPAEGQSVDRGSTVVLLVSKGQDLVAVPDIRGLTQSAAAAELAKSGLVGEVTGVLGGRVFATSPAAGQRVKRGSKVIVALS